MTVTIPLGPLERLPKWVFSIPFVAQWVLLALRYRSLSLPSAVNPDIETGGIVGESKNTCLSLIDAAYDPWVARCISIQAGEDPEARRVAEGLAYPLIAKPDIGWCGYGVCRIDDPQALAAYAEEFPSIATYLLQRLIDEPHEAGLLYMRRPGEPHGRITGVTLRHPPQVVGDGCSTLDALIKADARVASKAGFYTLSSAALAAVPASGAVVKLMTIASLRVGGRYEDAESLVTPVLTATLDAIARSMGRFHFGRFDVRFPSIEALREGRFTILEVNGAGSEAIQYWDPKYSLLQSVRGVCAKQNALFALADEMRRQVGPPIGWRALAEAHFRQQRLMRSYPAAN